ncbi:bifunctional diaminohydroxyphosphoribosylaminopyrimidine deaminase/5-amino-6-(5-phosphoribosylamino)uracil reductase [Roseivirga echinicomitans]|uniref:Riboflavin biosynthesis protein RibD n=2 Tax=Roseivirga echinicomitans TaxID=296218 RepID=A0A150XXC4_9BACT|nr:bifunctional diaminohydroxyphosphoribosylaminopyrimidine deaminase/5-amino-6-(5-phosphoribosylamino)uracil reductase [Roseivirga echinicomitans]
MQRALDLAELGRGHVSPNPMVGCVIVHNNTIIGEGYHQKYGGPHAEVNAINSVTNPDLLPESTCYVTLEPCAHFGRTPPCADLLVTKKIKKVVIASMDTNPLVGGKGVQKLKGAGIEVSIGVLESAARNLNRRFFTMIEKKRPYILLKWAQTADGFMARNNFDSKWISSEQSRMMVHQWRAEEDAILVGTNTAQYDNPRLDVRDWHGESPLRLVIDRHLRLPTDLNLFDGSLPTIVYNTVKTEEKEHLNFVEIGEKDFLQNILADLYERKVQSVLVEGGSFLLNSLMALGLWDEARVFECPVLFNEGIMAPSLKDASAETIQLQTDVLKIYRH